MPFTIGGKRTMIQTLEWLRQRGIEHKANPQSTAGFAQIFLLDPDRNVIELNAEAGFLK